MMERFFKAVINVFYILNQEEDFEADILKS